MNNQGGYQYNQGHSSGYVPPNQMPQDSQPLNQNCMPVMVRNQSTPTQTELDSIKKSLRSKPAFISCPYCGNSAITRTETSCSLLSVLCCVCTGLVPWLLGQVICGKDVNCDNADHFCLKCGNKLAEYNACCCVN